MIDIGQYNRIVAFGCSWTAGDELQDHKILNIKFKESQRLKIKHGFNNFHNLRTKQDIRFGQLIEEKEMLNRKSSWAAKLAKNLNLDFVNLAKGGSSLDEIYLQICKHKSTKMKNGDIIVVGLTSIYRMLQWQEGKPYRSSIITNLVTGSSIPKDVKRWNTDFLWTNNNLALNYYKTIHSLLSLDDNIYLQFMRPECNPMHYADNNLSPEIHFLHRQILQKYKHRFLVMDSFLRMDEKDSHCGFGHPPESSHTDLANEITKKLKG